MVEVTGFDASTGAHRLTQDLGLETERGEEVHLGTLGDHELSQYGEGTAELLRQYGELLGPQTAYAAACAVR